MPVETASLFAQVIQDHLELKERNAELEQEMPIDRYKHQDPFENHPLFKTEEQARFEETMDGQESLAAEPLEWPGKDGDATVLDEGLWRQSREFDWGD
jgi:hypothetical protein